MRPSRRANLLLTLSAGVLAVVLIVYAGLLWNWMQGPPPKPLAPAKPATEKSPDFLIAARASFRERFLDPHAHMRLAEALYRAGRPIDCFYVMLAARGLFGDEVFFKTHSLIVLRRKGPLSGDDDPPANEENLKKRLETDPRNPDLLNRLAHIHKDRGDLKAALALLDHGLAAAPENLELLVARARWTTDSLAAIPLYMRLAAISPDSYEGLRALEILQGFAQKEESGPEAESAALAREALERLFKKHPDSPGVFSALAMASWGKGGPQAARTLAAETLARNPRHAGATRIEGILALQDKQAEKALRYFSAAWEQNPEDLYSAEKLARLHAKDRADPEAAIPYYIALYRGDPRRELGGPLEDSLREILDARREAKLKGVVPDWLGRYLKSDDASLRAEACVRAAAARDPRWIGALGELLDDDAEIVRHNADYALFQIAQKHPDAVLVRRIDWLGSPKPLVRLRALNLFADLDPRNTFPVAAKALYDASPAVRYAAKTMVLDHYYKDDPRTAGALAHYLKFEKDPSVLALYARAPAPPAAAPAPAPKKRPPARSRRRPGTSL